jgi:tricorn protease
MKTVAAYACLFISLLLFPSIANSQITKDTRLISQPAISSKQIAFVYAEDLWVANIDGTNPKRLTIDEGIESNPVFSPDGKQIAFNAQYDGNRDVYIISSKGGIPKRLTWHPGIDIVQDFSPNGKKVLISSRRSSHTNRYFQLFEVPATGGSAIKSKVPNAFWTTYSDTGKSFAYTPLYEAFGQWKHYRGGMQSRIWIYNRKTHKVVEIHKPKGGSNDTKPQWMNGIVYFRSDRNGQFNLFSYTISSKQIKQLTNFKDFPVLNIQANNGNVVFEQRGAVHIYNAKNNKTRRLKINISTDLLELRQRYVSGKKYVRSADISPSGARVVVDFRGDIITIPTNKGDAKNITNTPGVHEKEPSWSPDGKSIAYFSDKSGEYALHIQSTSTGKVIEIDLNGAGFYAYIHWSPDSKKIAFVDNSRSLYITTVNDKKVSKIAADELYTPGVFRELFGSWSFDSSWISYTTINEANFSSAYLYSISEKKSHAVTDGFSNVTEPIFDPSGKYLYLLASTDAGPQVNWFDQSNNDMRTYNSMYLITLQKDTKSPFAKENDEEKIKEPKDKKKKESKDIKKDKKLIIDWKGFENRIVSMPLKQGNYSNLAAAKEGELFYIYRDDHGSILKKYSLAKRKEESLPSMNGFVIAKSGKKMLYFNKRTLFTSGLNGKGKPLNVASIKIKIDPKQEFKNIFEETWRVNRDYFYDPNMHGINWKAMKKKYLKFLPHVTSRGDLYRVLTWMCSEIGVGHHRFGSRGDRMNNPQRINGGLLGADYQVRNNRYQIKKIFEGLNWNPNLRAPLTEPGVNINPGDYIISVNGINLTATDNLFSFFENTVNKIVELTVSKDPKGASSRTVKVTPIGNEFSLRHRDWIEGNIKKVAKATNNQVAYVYVPNTAGAGHASFKRYFYPQAKKKAIIVDERFNGGGQLADYYIDMLKKPVQAYWNFRYGKDLKSPSASIQGPKVLITDETAGSGGDYFPWMFRKFKVGTIVGKRTWGGLVGVLGYPEFIDGGSVTAPNVAFYTENGFRVENEGVAPDIIVEQWPDQVIRGRDPQLEKAIEIALKELRKNPPKEMKRPAYPNKSKQ